MKLPTFLEPFRAELGPFQLEAVRMKATPLTAADSLHLTQSKFLGLPYLPIGFEYPKSRSGSPMILMAQLNFSEIPHLQGYPKSGILQLFLPGNDWYDMEEFRVLYHPDANLAFQTNFDFLKPELYDESPIDCEHRLEFTKVIEPGGAQDFRFGMTFGDLSYYEFHEKLSSEEQAEMDAYFESTGHKVGGYGYFTQADPRDYDPALDDDVQLFQIDSEGRIMWGDVGVAHVFLNANDLKALDFGKAYFYYDCC